MDVTLATGTLTITNDDGTTDVINLSNAVDIGVLTNYPRSFDPSTNEMVVGPASYVVQLRATDWRWWYFRMGEIDNQATWTDTLSGANTAVADISANLA